MELMIAVAIVGILTAVALPSYRQYIIRSNRAAAQSEMMDIANRQQQYLLANRAYATDTELGYTLPADIAKHYSAAIAADNAATPPTFTITFTPTGSQSSDGALSLNNSGGKTPASKW